MAQNDTHVALITLITQMWGGGGGIIGGKNFFGPKFVFLCLWRQHPFLHKTKGPTRNPISPTPPPSFGGRPCHPPPPPPQSNFQVAQTPSAASPSCLREQRLVMSSDQGTRALSRVTVSQAHCDGRRATRPNHEQIKRSPKVRCTPLPTRLDYVHCFWAAKHGTPSASPWTVKSCLRGRGGGHLGPWPTLTPPPPAGMY